MTEKPIIFNAAMARIARRFVKFCKVRSKRLTAR